MRTNLLLSLIATLAVGCAAPSLEEEECFEEWCESDRADEAGDIDLSDADREDGATLAVRNTREDRYLKLDLSRATCGQTTPTTGSSGSSPNAGYFVRVDIRNEGPGDLELRGARRMGLLGRIPVIGALFGRESPAIHYTPVGNTRSTTTGGGFPTLPYAPLDQNEGCDDIDDGELRGGIYIGGERAGGDRLSPGQNAVAFFRASWTAQWYPDNEYRSSPASTGAVLRIPVKVHDAQVARVIIRTTVNPTCGSATTIGGTTIGGSSTTSGSSSTTPDVNALLNMACSEVQRSQVDRCGAPQNVECDRVTTLPTEPSR